LEIFVYPTGQGIVATSKLLADLVAAVSLLEQSNRISAVAKILLLMTVVQFLPLLFIKCLLLQGLCAIHLVLPSFSPYLIAGRE
jgi:hypothetical protein